MIARAAYALLFCALLPALLVLWAHRLDLLDVAPRIEPGAWGWAIAGAGALFVGWSMSALLRIGGGLPMNAFPPPRFVARGPYALTADPIYLGCAAIIAGSALALGSGGGWWIVTPAFLAASTALVLGYERPDLERRFGLERPAPLASAPPADGRRVSLRDVFGVWIGLYLPWVIGYEYLGHLPVAGPIELMREPEASRQVWTITTPVYSSVYLVALVAPFLASSRTTLRRWVLDARFGIVLGFLCFLLLPFIATPRAFDLDAPFGRLLALERSDGLGGRGAFPSFHVFWSIFFALLIAERGRRFALLGAAWALAVMISCVTTGMHASIDVVAGAGLAFIARARLPLWQAALRGAEFVAGSWRERHIGPVRIINHGCFAGLAAAVGVGVIGALRGPGGAGAVAIIALASLVGAALWGQYWVGSAKLLRPFGYFGSVLGVSVALTGIAIAGVEVWPLAAAVAVAAPWAQAIGRLRCLVQGCCHGRPVREGESGIIYRHPRSRVVALAELGGVPIHATPLYSILANLVIGALLVRLIFVGASCSFILGASLLLAGCARFVEESRRGEPHTPVRGGLRLYQWCAIGLLLAGALCTCLPSPAAPAPAGLDGTTLLLALAIGLLHAVAMGVDFPAGTRRFSRLL